MTGIFYFSATGNSLYVAQRLQSILGGSVRYIPGYEGNGEEYEQVVIVSPSILSVCLFMFMISYQS